MICPVSKDPCTRTHCRETGMCERSEAYPERSKTVVQMERGDELERQLAEAWADNRLWRNLFFALASGSILAMVWMVWSLR